MIATEAPCLPNCVEISKPIPEPPPVKRATLPFSKSDLNADSIANGIGFSEDGLREEANRELAGEEGKYKVVKYK